METLAAPTKIGKFRASYLLAAESFELFRKDKEIAWYAIWNIVWVLLITVLFVSALGGLLFFTDVALLAEGEQAGLGMEAAGYTALFLLYVAAHYITTYYGVALTYVVSKRIDGGDATYADGIRAARSRKGRIFRWALLASTVGLILQVISDRAPWAGKMISFLSGVAWNVATFFMIPVLAREEEGVSGLVKRSGQVFISTWGETLIMNFSLGVFFGALHLVLLGIFAVVGYMILTTSVSLAAFAVLLGSYIILFSLLALVSSILSSVFRVVLYEYATRGIVPDSFTPELILGAIKKAPAK